ncbi:L-galactose dehydrogenase-like isoform X2 [Schistocerca piceifrons]|uniref:L-galactose dehydrogenase-like isoform X2 n=1 Tax=Schistocerca piceifrons TaxID=274613 RepID=UPI001F5F4A78|nr:L-galactose dehydrogenase-like isoform X2 [Schistocerca piceifrons]
MSPPTSPPTGLPPTFVPGFHDEAAVRAMRYNPLGETGLYVSHLGCGGGVLSSLYGSITEEECIATIREAIRQGVNYIDTAPWYGQGRSEDILGKALKEVPRQAYYIGTKVGRYELDPRHMFDFSASKTRQSIEKSLKLLQLDYVDILQVHDVEFAPDPEMVVNETLPVVKEAVEAGKARFIGITGYPVSALKDIITRSKDIRISTVLSYCRDTLIDSTLQEYMPFFKSQGVELGKLAVYHALTREGQATHLVGANCREVLRLNLRTLREGLTEAERQVLKHVKDRFFADLKVRHWEGKELREREAILKELAEKEKLEGKS